MHPAPKHPTGPETARVALYTQRLTPPDLKSYVATIYLGMKNSTIYGTTTVDAQDLLLDSRDALIAQIDAVANLETDLRTARLTLAGSMESAQQRGLGTAPPARPGSTHAAAHRSETRLGRSRRSGPGTLDPRGQRALL
jgi:hypothetical protein